MRETFIFNQIRKYNQARRQSLKDAALTAIGIHAGLLKKKRVIIRDLQPEEREQVLDFVRKFLNDQGIEIAID